MSAHGKACTSCSIAVCAWSMLEWLAHSHGSPDERARVIACSPCSHCLPTPRVSTRSGGRSHTHTSAVADGSSGSSTRASWSAHSCPFTALLLSSETHLCGCCDRSIDRTSTGSLALHDVLGWMRAGGDTTRDTHVSCALLGEQPVCRGARCRVFVCPRAAQHELTSLPPRALLVWR